MQRIKELFTGEDRGVSPVIGVILMVAITVILAAVIATFVIGLGDSTDDVQPNVSFDSEFGNDTSGATNAVNATISIDTTDSGVDASNIVISGDNVSEQTWEDKTGNSELAAGQEATFSGQFEGDEIRIVFETDESSSNLDTIDVADA